MSTTAAGATTISSVRHILPTSKSKTTSDFIVVGAGIFGVWTAYHLQKLGSQVTLIDGYGPGNARASSGGETRILRSDYGDKTIYTRLNLSAYKLWTQFQAEWDAELIVSTGRLKLGDGQMTASVQKSKVILEKYGVDSEILDHKELSYRWPNIRFDGIEVGHYFPGGAGGSAIFAQAACLRIAKEFENLGGRIVTAHVVPPEDAVDLDSIKDTQGESYRADTFIFACGPWMSKLFPRTIQPKLSVYRRDVLFYGTKAGDASYSYPNFPIWSFSNPGDRRYYGMPDFYGRGFKVAPWPDFNSIDMDNDQRLVNPIEIKRADEFIKRRFPGLAGQPIVQSRVCQLSMTADEDFIIDAHPSLKNVFLAFGGSGHAFKHGPAIGRYIANRLINNVEDLELDSQFSWSK